MEALTKAVAAALGLELDPAATVPVAGGDINRACRMQSAGGRSGDGGKGGRGGEKADDGQVGRDGRADRNDRPAAGRAVFVKVNRASRLGMFEAEAEGLRELAAAGELRVPSVLGSGSAGDTAWLALEWLELGAGGPAAARALGAGLAALHRHTADAHGWHRDNTIGSTPQRNARDSDWVAFYGEQRLRRQLELAAASDRGGGLTAMGERLIERLPAFFEDYAPVPSLLHGDLWGGNWAALQDPAHAGEPVVFDPAVYYGDRETDIAMTRLFGGFGAAFYEAYEDAWPLDAGYRRREPLYQLYHVLNHLNLFGGHYLGRARSLMQTLLG